VKRALSTSSADAGGIHRKVARRRRRQRIPDSLSVEERPCTSGRERYEMLQQVEAQVNFDLRLRTSIEG